MKTFRLRVLSVLMAALLIGLLAGSARAQAPREIVIGVIYPLSGNLAQIGIDSVTAIRMATEIFNGRSRLNLPSARKTTDGLPGLGGAKIRLVVVDHQGKPELGQAEAERLITQEKVTALLGSVHSSVTATASQVAERYGVPFMNGESSSPHDDHFSQAMFDFIRDFEKKRGIKVKTVGIMHEDTLFGADSAKVQEGLAKRDGYAIVARMAYRSRTTSLDAEVTRVKAANPDIFLPTSHTTDATLYSRPRARSTTSPSCSSPRTRAGWTRPSSRRCARTSKGTSPARPSRSISRRRSR